MTLPSNIELALRQLRAVREQAALDFQQAVLTDGAVSCQRGCSNCCHYPLFISILEGVLVYQWLADRRLWVQGLRQRFLDAARQTWRLSLQTWMLSNTPCPLLDKDDLCRAYEGRPLYCRTAYSRGEPHFCHPHRFLQAESLVSRNEPTGVMAEAEASILKKLRLKRVLLPFAVSVLYGECVGKGLFDLREADALTLEAHRPW
jgi:Fe-S-cluster containining protein